MHLFSVLNPVQVPPPYRCTIVDAQNIDVLDLKSGGLYLPNHPPERAGSISTWEDVLVHEETPERGEYARLTRRRREPTR